MATAPLDTSASAYGDFAAGYPFALDEFQRRACDALERGKGVLVAAPTGAGKTIVGEFAVFLALRQGRKCFYTAPIKALSNQKFGDLVARYGEDNVGLLTGDNAVNGDAPIVVMTTEVLRNMLYSGSDALRGLGYVVMDEVHYLADRFRGAVWEEVIIHLPDSVTLVSLSATVSNAEEFAEWLVTVRGDTEVIVEEHRPVPLWQHVLVGNRMYDLFAGQEDGHTGVNPALVRIAREDSNNRFSKRGRGAPRTTFRTPSRVDVIERLEREHLLPAITFIFSRAGCDAAVNQCRLSGMRLNTPEESAQVRKYVASRTRDLPEEDLLVLRFHEFAEALERGIASHHAGMLPTFKEIVEELFSRGLVKAVFATETLALGINMPARCVVLEKLVKWNGEMHADITPGEYTQLTGRAGRRGIDVEGHAVVLWQPQTDPMALAGLASTRTYPLKSSFRPSYNMAVNLVRQLGRASARTLLESSFAQFQADRSVVGLARQVSKQEDAIAGYRESASCELGDFGDYFALRVKIRDREAEIARTSSSSRRAAAATVLEQLRPGDVISVPAGRRRGLAVVIDPAGGSPVVVTADRQSRKLSVADFPVAPDVLGRVRIPKGFNSRSPQARRDLAAQLHGVETPDRGRPERSGAADDPVLARLRAAMREHPCHQCPEREDHARWAERADRLERDTAGLSKRMAGRTNTIARVFDRVCQVLDELGYLSADDVTPDGDQLAGLYAEADLLVIECLRSGLWDQLTPAELASAVSPLVYESRSANQSSPRPAPAKPAAAISDMMRRWERLNGIERDHHLDGMREPDPGFAWASYQWAGGRSLEDVLSTEELTAGDFVRWCKQLMDL
ncbi:MAG: ATP-dependent helicase HelY, partial [Frankiaceae bacterium]|nr:ATP-dependent helicase HelY [Frankiaceae bacterium]